MDDRCWFAKREPRPARFRQAGAARGTRGWCVGLSMGCLMVCGLTSVARRTPHAMGLSQMAAGKAAREGAAANPRGVARRWGCSSRDGDKRWAMKRGTRMGTRRALSINTPLEAAPARSWHSHSDPPRKRSRPFAGFARASCWGGAPWGCTQTQSGTQATAIWYPVPHAESGRYRTESKTCRHIRLCLNKLLTRPY